MGKISNLKAVSLDDSCIFQFRGIVDNRADAETRSESLESAVARFTMLGTKIGRPSKAEVENDLAA